MLSRMKKVFHEAYKHKENKVDAIIQKFDQSGKQLGKGERNKIKLYQLDDKTINVKSFKVPNIFNQIAYRFFRKSKAQRSFEYANKLSHLGIGTPQPIAYYEFPSVSLYKKSFYISEHLDCDLTFRELTTDLNYPNHETILRAFTRFTYKLHQIDINFLDHSPGNTLIKKVGEEYIFFLVDLNRMEFKKMNLETRIKNLSRLTIQEDLVKIMSDEYAKLSNVSFDKIYNMLWYDINRFQNKIKRKKMLKKKLLFRK